MTLKIDLVRALKESEYLADISNEIESDMKETVMIEAADYIERLIYVLDGVRGAIKTGRKEHLVIWSEQIDIALGDR